MIVRIHNWNHLVLGFPESFFVFTDSISLLTIGLFTFSISTWFSLGKLHVSRNLSIPRFPIWWCMFAHICLSQSFVFLWCHCNVSYFISDFICLNSFFLVNLVTSLSILFIISKSQLLFSLIFSIHSLVSISIFFLLWSLLIPSISNFALRFFFFFLLFHKVFYLISFLFLFFKFHSFIYFWPNWVSVDVQAFL